MVFILTAMGSLDGVSYALEYKFSDLECLAGRRASRESPPLYRTRRAQLTQQD